MENWEYKTLTTSKSMWTAKDKTDIDKTLNDLGRDGWNLVSVVPLSSSAGGSTTGLQLFFKRKRF